MNKPKTKEKQKEAYKIIHKIIKTLKDPDVDLPEFVLARKLNYAEGWCDYTKITLGVFYNLIPTIIHEMIHYIHEDWSETKVINSERLIKRYIKMKDVITILKLFLNIISIEPQRFDFSAKIHKKIQRLTKDFYTDIVKS